jgi:hypothetical protein
MRNVFPAILMLGCVFLGFLAGTTAAEGQFETRIEERALVLECMTEYGWEMADEEAAPNVQVEQSLAWCEAFVRD